MKTINIKVLEEAVTMASEWRGSLLPPDYPEFDQKIAEMRQAINDVKELQHRMKELEK
jgi:hypothetical protein